MVGTKRSEDEYRQVVLVFPVLDIRLFCTQIKQLHCQTCRLYSWYNFLQHPPFSQLIHTLSQMMILLGSSHDYLFALVSTVALQNLSKFNSETIK